jgi:hypothetical protein
MTQQIKTAVIGSSALSQAQAAMVVGNGTPSHDMFARSRYFPGPQHGRWRVGLSGARLLEGGGSESWARYTYRDGVVGGVVAFEGAAWTDAGKTIESAGAFAGLTWNDNMVVVIKSGTGWVPGIYKVASIPDDDTITLLDPIDVDFAEVSGKWPGADNADTEGYLCLGFYQETYTPIGAPMGASGSGNQFNLPGTSSTDSFTFWQSKYWDYETFTLPAHGLGGGARCVLRMSGRAKFADLGVHPYDSESANFPGAYNVDGRVRVRLVLDPWSSVFRSLGSNHTDVGFYPPQLTAIGWTPGGGPRANTFVLDGSDLRVVGGSLGDSFSGDSRALYFCKYDKDSTDWPDIEGGQAYWVDALAGANQGRYELYLDKSLATVVTSVAADGEAVVSVGASKSLFAMEWTFDVEARTSYLRNCDATAATDQISHPSLASRVVGDELVCLQGDGSGLSANAPVTLSAVSATASTDVISVAGLSSLSVGDALLCLEAGASGLAVGVTYYIKTKPTSTTAELSLTPGGALFDVTSDATGLSFLYTNVYYIASKPTPTTATLSLSRGGGSVFNIATDADEVSFSYTDPLGVDMDDFGVLQFEVVLDADGSSDNLETGIRASALMRWIPLTETVGPVAFGAQSSGGFKEYRGALSRTFPGRSSDDTATGLVSVGAPQARAKVAYYNDGTNDYDAYYSSRFDWGGDWDVVRLNGDALMWSALVNAGEYDYPLRSVQGVEAHGESSNGRRATMTYVYRNAETTPIAEVLWYDQAHRALVVRSLLEDERIVRGDALTLKTWRYVRTTTVSNLVWNAAARTLTATGAWTNFTHSAGIKVCINSAANNDGTYLRAHLPDFAPGFFEVESKDASGDFIVLTSAAAASFPSYTPASGSLTFSGYYERPAGTAWNFEVTPIQSLTKIRGPRFVRGSYVAATGVTTLSSEDLVGWTWWSGARVLIKSGTGFTAGTYYTITAATSTTITISGGPGADALNVEGQLETNTDIEAEMVDMGPHPINGAARLAVTGPPSGDCELEINTYSAELIDAGSR